VVAEKGSDLADVLVEVAASTLRIHQRVTEVDQPVRIDVGEVNLLRVDDVEGYTDPAVTIDSGGLLEYEFQEEIQIDLAPVSAPINHVLHLLLGGLRVNYQHID